MKKEKVNTERRKYLKEKNVQATEQKGMLKKITEKDANKRN